MLSINTKRHLVSSIASKDIADDVEKRLELQALSSYKQDIKKIREWLIVAMANKKHGDLFADKLQQAAHCLDVQANDHANLAAAQAAFDSAPFSAEFMKVLVVALTDKDAAHEIEAKHNALIAAVAALS